MNVFLNLIFSPSKTAVRFSYTLCVFLFSFSSIPAAENYTIRQITALEGLSQNDVEAVFLDSRGFLWIATNDGLNRYDGHEFYYYGIGTNGLASNLIIAIDEDSRGNLWIGTADKGLIWYNRSEDIFVSMSDLAPEKLSGSTSFGIVYVDPEDGIWLYNKLDKVLRKMNFDPLTNTVKNVIVYDLKDNEIPLTVYSICTYKNEVIVATNKGLYACAPYTEKTTLFYDINEPMHTLLKISDRNLIYTNLNGVYSLDLYNERKIHLDDTPGIIDIFYRNNQLYYVNDEGLHIANYDAEQNCILQKQMRPHESSYIVKAMTVGESGSVWVGFLKAGLFCYHKNRLNIEYYGRYGNNHILPIMEDWDGKLWLGTEGTGTFYLNDTFGIKNSFHSGQVIYSIAQSSFNGHLYISAEGHPLYQIDLKDKKLEASPPTIKGGARVLLSDANYLWMGYYNGGVCRLNIATGETYYLKESDGLSSNIVRNIMKDHRDNIWIATGQGLCVIEADKRFGENMSVYHIEHSAVSTDYIIPLIEDRSHNIWYGTLGKGLKKMSNITPEFTFDLHEYNTTNGLGSNSVKAILEDNEGHIWFSTNRGIHCIDPKTDRIQIFDVADGLQDYEFNELSACKRSDGQLIFGGVNGMNAFYPELFVPDTIAVTPILTDFLIFNNSVRTDSLFRSRFANISEVKEIELPHNENSFTFVFSGLYFPNPRKVKYQYQLEGFNKDWVETTSGRREANYTNLPPGKYLFKLRASNPDGSWSKNELILPLIITPPFWRTWYALLIYILCVCAFLYYVKTTYIKRMKRKNEILIANFEKKRSEEMLEMKTRFFTNISHEFRTPLTLILSPLQMMLNDRPMAADERYGKMLKVMSFNGNRLMRLINDLLSFSKAEQGRLNLHLQYKDLSKLSHTLFEQFIYWADQKNIQMNYSSSAKHIRLFFDPYLMEQVIFNLMSNAVKHTPDYGTISFSLDEQETYVQFFVSDSGKGISPELQSHLFERFYSTPSSVARISANNGTGIGLFLTKTLVEMHGGNISFETEENKGTIFKVTLPKKITDEIPGENVQENDTIDFRPEKTVFIEKPDDSCDKKEEPVDKQTILAVDDNPEICKLLVSVFEKDYKVMTASGGKEALRMALDIIPDLIISDVIMPEMSGTKLCEQIKSDERISHIPVILLTAKAGAQDMVTGFRSLADSYCAKPFDNKVLKELIRTTLINRVRIANLFKSRKNIHPSEITTTAVDEKFLKKLLHIVEENLIRSDFVVDDICRALGMSSLTLSKKTKSLTGLTPNAFVRSIRMKRAAKLLETGRYTVSEVTYDVGFNDLKSLLF